ncbi:MAG: LysR family transcriptional regulator [Paracoccaceae bacterium]|nr:LysR family transcriptional regulator [Paracoccaceae bacterium]
MEHLNYHHLRYFREVAREGHLTRTAERLNVSQSALSSQIRALEDQLGHALFERVGRRLELTEVGRIALDHADRIFDTGAELLATLRQSGHAMPPLRIGALSTLSRNYQLRFLAPVLGRDDLDISLRSGPEEGLMAALRALALDVVLSTEPPRDGVGAELVAQRLAEQPVGIHGRPERLHHASLRALLQNEGFILPTETAIRAGFLGRAEQLGVQPRIVADVDDMAMVRLLAREGAGLAVSPAVVVADELAAGRLATAPFALKVVESFYAITLRRSFPHPLLDTLLKAATSDG